MTCSWTIPFICPDTRFYIIQNLYPDASWVTPLSIQLYVFGIAAVDGASRKACFKWKSEKYQVLSWAVNDSRVLRFVILGRQGQCNI